MKEAGNFDGKNKLKKISSAKRFYLLSGLIMGIIIFAALYQTSVYFSTNESCMICHVHPHAEETWKLSVHVNKSGVMTNCRLSSSSDRKYMGSL